MRRTLALFAFFSAALVACSGSSTEDHDGPTDVTSSAYDTFYEPTFHGELEPGATNMAVFTESERFHAFDFFVPTKASVRLFTAPDAAVVDTVMYLYEQGDAGWGPSIAKSDDARATPWSEIRRELEPGVYRVLVKGRTTRERGAFYVGFECPTCAADSACVFGDVFGKVRRGLSVKVENERLVDHPSQLSALEKLQLVDALHESSHTDVTTPEEALARIDAGEVNVLRLWDASNARAFVAFEYGAGDNSYGRIYPLDAATAVVGIHDGDLVRCAVPRGALGRDCRAAKDCGAGACEGLTSKAPGTCVAQEAPPGTSDSCSEAISCGPGLACAGLTRGPEGICLPEWMQRTFLDWQGVPLRKGEGTGAEASRYLDAHGLATVDMDVRVEAILRAPARGPVTITLTNPLGTIATVFAGESTGKDLHVATNVRGFSGDESVNGRWTLHVATAKAEGSLERWSLMVGSRFD